MISINGVSAKPSRIPAANIFENIETGGITLLVQAVAMSIECGSKLAKIFGRDKS